LAIVEVPSQERTIKFSQMHWIKNDTSVNVGYYVAGWRPVDKYLTINCQCTFLTQTVEVTHVKMISWNGYK